MAIVPPLTPGMVSVIPNASPLKKVLAVFNIFTFLETLCFFQNSRVFFQFQKRAFFFKAAGITGEAAIRAQNPVAWNEQ